jgi:hypothetical protein
MEMYDFFYNELQTLKAKTGSLQWEKLNALDNSAKEIDDLINFMVIECGKDPFKCVKPEVKQRVIARAIIDDDEFIGLNAKFVRRALNAWWKVYGDRIIEAMNQKSAEVYKMPDRTPEQTRDLDKKINDYINQLLAGSEIKIVPKMDSSEVAKKGAEWKSEIERKGTKYSNGLTIEQFRMMEKINRVKSDFHKKEIDFRNYIIFHIDGYEVFAKDKEQAQEIYAAALSL